MDNSEDQTYSAFAARLDGALSKPLPAGVIAFCFNLYEHAMSFQIQLSVSDAFDPKHAEWAVNAVPFPSEDDLFGIGHNGREGEWQHGLAVARRLVLRYLREGERANVLRSSQGVACGFVDGDLEILWPVV